MTPTKEEFLQIVRFLNNTAAGRVYATHCLKEIFPPAVDFTMRAAGLLSVPISRIPRDYLVFFRREAVRTVTWAGDPRRSRSRARTVSGSRRAKASRHGGRRCDTSRSAGTRGTFGRRNRCGLPWSNWSCA